MYCLDWKGVCYCDICKEKKKMNSLMDVHVHVAVVATKSFHSQSSVENPIHRTSSPKTDL